MDHLVTALQGLDDADQRELMRFISLKKAKSERKDVELIQQLISGKKNKADTKQESDRINQNRKRIWNTLGDFISWKEMQEETSPIAKMMSYVSLSRYLFSLRLQKPGWKFLSKAEELASQSERYDILKSIYLLKLENSQYEFAENIKITIQKIETNNRLLDVDERILMASNMIRYNLDKLMELPSEESFSDIVEDVLTKFKLTYSSFRSARQIHDLLSIIRSSFLVEKNLHNFESFASEQYERLMAENSFDVFNHYYKLEILYMIAHANFRNRNYRRCLFYLEELNTNITLFNGDYYSRFYPKYIAMKCNLQSLMGSNDDAIILCEEILKSKKLKLSVKDSYNISLSLAVFYFNAKKYKLANRMFLNAQHTDDFLQKRLGLDWVIRKNIIFSIVQYESGNEDNCLLIIKKLQKKYAEVFRTSDYYRVRNYLQLVVQFVKDPSLFTKNYFSSEADKHFIRNTLDQEEYKMIAFFTWLKSKAEKTDYYETLVDLIKTNSKFK